jgi:hypothetical protein
MSLRIEWIENTSGQTASSCQLKPAKQTLAWSQASR